MRKYRHNYSSTSSGIGTLGVLQIIFMVLKFTGLINWSWPVVLIPLWIDLGLVALIILIFLISWRKI